jgi:hypothetical protein
MKKTLFLTGLSFLCFMQAYGQTVQPSDSLKKIPAVNTAKAIPDTTASAMAAVPGKTVVPKKLKKSARKAFFLSLLVPGSGEYYVGQKGYTKGFVAAEAVIWSAALYNKYQGDIRRRDYISYAAQQAGSNSSRTDDFYYQNVYEWPNSYWYNEDQWRQARDLYPYDPAAQQAYVADKLYSPEDAWEWQDYGQWEKYRSLRVKSRNSLHWISYSVGAAVLNHMLSAVNKQRTKLSQTADWRLECYSHRPETLTLTLWRSF